MDSEDLEEDYELTKFLLKRKGIKPPPKSAFKGLESVSSHHETILLDTNHLINYD